MNLDESSSGSATGTAATSVRAMAKVRAARIMTLIDVFSTEIPEGVEVEHNDYRTRVVRPDIQMIIIGSLLPWQ